MSKAKKITIAIVSVVVLIGLALGAYFLIFKKNTETIVIKTTANIANQSEISGAGVYEVGEQVTLKAGEVKGYTFRNWTKEGQLVRSSSEYKFKASKETEGTYKANYTANNYEINKGEGTLTFTTVENADFSSLVSVTNLPTAKRGYYIRTYYVKEGSTNKVDFENSFLMPASNITIYAEEAIANYKIKYNVDGGTLSNNKVTYTFLDETFTLVNPTKPGYEFLGWVDSKNTMPNKEYKIEKDSIGDVEVTAKYEAKTYNITKSEITKATVVVSETAKTDSEVNVSITPNAGYTLNRVYYKVENTETEVDIKNNKFKMPVGNISIFANFNTIEYTITYNLNDGTCDSSQLKNTYTVETETFTLPLVMKKDSDFTGWTDETNTTPNINYSVTKGTTGNLVLTANFGVKTYTITKGPSIGDNGGYSFSVPNSAQAGVRITPIIYSSPDSEYEVTESYYMVKGNSNKNNFNIQTGFIMPSSDITVYVIFKSSETTQPDNPETPTTYTISKGKLPISVGGNFSVPSSAAAGEKVSIYIMMDVEDNYEATSAYYIENGSSERRNIDLRTGFIMPSSNITVYVIFTKK